MQETVNTVVPTGCSTVIVADVNARSSIDSVQLGFGQSGAPAMIGSGDTVGTGADGSVRCASGCGGLNVRRRSVIGRGLGVLPTEVVDEDGHWWLST